MTVILSDNHVGTSHGILWDTTSVQGNPMIYDDVTDKTANQIDSDYTDYDDQGV